MDTEYNGWTNYPTWAVNLWLCNDEGLDATLTEYARRNDPEGLSAYVRDDLTPELPAGPGADLLGWAFDKVNWGEIIESRRYDLDDEG